MRILSFKKVDQYFKNLAEKHVDIKDYCGTSVTELSEKMASVDGIISPVLVFFDIYSKLSGTEQRTFNNRTLAFSILFSGISNDDFDAQRDAIDNAEAIGLEVLSRINIESKMPQSGWLYNNFIKESVHYEEVKFEKAEGFFGMDFHFDLKVLEPLVVDKAKWTDGNIFCG